MIEIKNNEGFKEVDEIKVVDVFESDNEAVFKGSGENLENYRIYGNTVNSESVGDLVFDGDHAGEYRVPVTINDITTNLYLPEQIRKVGSEAEYIDYGEQKQHRVRKNLLPNTAISQTINGVTFTVNEDGSVTCNGTATNTAEVRLVTTTFPLPAGNYRLTGAPSGGGTSSYSLRAWYNNSGSTVWIYDTGNGYDFTLTDTAKLLGSIVIRPDQVLDNITFYPMIRKADIQDDTYEPYITDTELDVTLPALPTLSGTNTLSVNTNTKPSKVWGRLSDPRDILYVKDNLGNILFSKYHEIEDEPPLTYTAKNAGTLKNYRIYGNTVDGESVGDRTGNLFNYETMSGISGKRLDSNGNEITDSQWAISGFIPCTGNAFTISKLGGGIPAICLYDENQNFITGKAYNTGSAEIKRSITITAEETAKFVRFSYFISNAYPTAIDDLTKIMLNSGSTPLPYEPYGYRVPVTINDVTTNLYLPEPIRKVGNEAEYIDYVEQKQHFVGGTSVDVTLPALPTIAGTNTLSVGTGVQPAKVMVRGKIKEVL